ncbi:MAG: hypothetical protein QOG92_460, partial [Verrucomicrobiota bacterium]|nr:hypothetical protein [Verrucomicrobiota bacterium]
TQDNGSDQIGENLKASAQVKKELARTPICRKLKPFNHAQ